MPRIDPKNTFHLAAVCLLLKLGEVQIGESRNPLSPADGSEGRGGAEGEARTVPGEEVERGNRARGMRKNWERCKSDGEVART